MTSYIKTGDNGFRNYLRQHKRQLTIAGYVVTAIYLLFSLIFSDLGLLKYFSIKRDHNRLSHEISQLDSSNKSLREEVTKLKTDPDYIESIARDKLGLVKEGEKVYKFEERTNQK
ncbi:MAG: septum formation initiator family protein [Nitrospirae bacterium]|nr:septum formation initiator family protein [Nitrospirota bacterium]